VSFRVDWRPAAERHLAQLWVDAPDRQAVTDAADWLEAEMTRDPMNLGESRDGQRRMAFRGPLGISFVSMRVAISLWSGRSGGRTPADCRAPGTGIAPHSGV